MSSDPLTMANMQVPILIFMSLNLLSNFSGELLSCDVQKVFDTNMYAKHVLGMLLMIFFNIMNDPVNAENIGKSIGEALALYAWFVLLSRTHVWVATAIVGVVFSVYVIDIRVKRAQAKHKDGDDSESAAKMKRASVILKWVALGMTLAGVAHYMFLKRREYKADFSILRFFVGTTHCRRN